MKRIILAACVSTAVVQSGFAADPEPASRAEVEELRREVQELKSQIRELLQQRAPERAAAVPSESAASQTPAPPAQKAAASESARASKTVAPYSTAERSESPVRIFGYGEANYNRYIDDSSRSQADLRRFVVGFGYAFSDALHFNSEVEWEHAVTSADDQGEVEIEQAVLDYQINSKLNVKGGLFLMPVGLLNRNHEPPVFYGVERNEVETRIIPTTWREGGFGLTWVADNGFTYELGITTGFDVTKFDDPSAPLRSMHQELQNARAHDLGYYGAVNYQGIPGLLLGGSVFTGNSTQGNAAFKADTTQPDFTGLNGRVMLWDVHGRWQPGRLDLQALYARGYISQAAQLNAVLSSFNQATGETRALVPNGFYGWYTQAAYRVWERESMSLSPFVRYEYYNTQSSLSDGMLADSENASHVLTAGLTFRLHPQVVIKADYQKYVEHSQSNRIDLGLGYMF